MRFIKRLTVVGAFVTAAIVGFAGTAQASVTQGPYTVDGNYSKVTQLYAIWTDTNTGRYTFDLTDDVSDGWSGRAFVYVDYRLGNPDGSVSSLRLTYTHNDPYGGGASGHSRTVDLANTGDYSYSIYSFTVYTGRYNSSGAQRDNCCFRVMYNPYYVYPG